MTLNKIKFQILLWKVETISNHNDGFVKDSYLNLIIQLRDFLNKEIEEIINKKKIIQ